MKIAICGDSISEGIGSLKINYTEFLQEKLTNAEIKNFAHTGTMISYIDEIKNDIQDFNPDILIIFYGNVDAMTRPNSNSILYKLLPKRYKKNGMLSPRALYNKKIYIRGLQKIESIFRTTLNKMLINTTGYELWNPIEKFEKEYRLVLEQNKTSINILISTVPVYDSWFPYTNQNYIKYNSVIKNIAQEYNCDYLDLYGILSNYEKKEIFLADYFHLSEDGYKIVAENISEIIRNK